MIDAEKFSSELLSDFLEKHPILLHWDVKGPIAETFNSATGLFPIRGVKPHRSTLCTYGA